MTSFAHCKWNYNKATGIVKRDGTIIGSANNETGRLRISYHGKSMQMTRLIWFFVMKRWPKPGWVIDHINDDPTDNRWCNLQEITQSHNVLKANKHFLFDGERYKVILTVLGKRYNLGKFDTNEEALIERNRFLSVIFKTI